MTSTKFVVHLGRVVSQDRIDNDAVNEAVFRTAHDIFDRLSQSEPTVSVSWPDGKEGFVGLGLPPAQPPNERLSEAMRKNWENGREARERTKRESSFYIVTSGVTELYWLTRDQVPNMVLHASAFGAVAGTLAAENRGKAEHERESLVDARPNIERVASNVIASAPAFMCRGQLQGAAAAFVDCLAMVMLSTAGTPSGESRSSES